MTNLIEHLETQRDVLRRAVDGVPRSQREQRPASDRWSVAEVLEHLAMVEHRVAAMISDVIESAPALAKGDKLRSSEAAVDQQLASLLDRSRRVETRESTRPTGNLDARAAWADLEKSRSELLEILERAEGLDLGGFKHAHPQLGPLDTYEWIAFVGGHEARHAAQIDEIASQITPIKR